MFGTIKAFFFALTQFLIVYPIKLENTIDNEIDKIEDEIFNLGISGTPSDKLRIEQLHKRRTRKKQQLSSLRSTNNHTK